MEQIKRKKKQNLRRIVESFNQEAALFDKGARILIGVSGGPDSMALLSLLSELRPKWNLDLTVLYCHHGLRAAADEEEAFVRSWAEKWSCIFFSRKLPVREYQRKSGRSLQEAARELRYQASEDFVKKKNIDRVALAHTANDQAEEVLIGLVRGAGLGGLAGIPAKRGQVIRPLIRTYRQEILDYLAIKEIPYKEDLSNRDFRYLRARVRHHLLPELGKYSPNIVAQLNQTARLLQKDEEYLKEKVDQMEPAVLSCSGATATLSRHQLAELPQALSSRLIQKAVSATLGHLRHFRAVHILSILKAAQGNRPQGTIPLPNGFSAKWNRKDIKILRTDSDPKPMVPFFYEIEKPLDVFIQETGEWVAFKKVKAGSNAFKLPGLKNRVRVDFNKLSWPLVIRNLRPGDRFRPLGMEGSKKVSRFFIDRKVPRALRDRIPLVLSGGEIVWIGGMEIGQPFCQDHHTTLVLEIVYRKEKGL